MSVLTDRLKAKGPKRMLALDGGGIRGAITLGYLEKIESILIDRHHNPDLRLCDYFDLIGGTSTGAIIASGLAIGMRAGEIKALYLKLGKKIFGKKRKLFKRLSAKFEIKALNRELENIFGDIKLGGPEIKTGLCIVTKRADTGSTWPLINHPDGKFFEFNKEMLLRQVVRASTAAPTYFQPEKISVGAGQIGAFVDGGVSMYNNPSMQLFLLATLKGFPFNWPGGEDQLLLTSVGTGFWEKRRSIEDVTDNKLWDWASDVISSLMNDAGDMNELLLQYISNSPTARELDSEIGNLEKDLLTPKAAIHYLRYDARLEDKALDLLGFDKVEADSLHEMSASENCEILAKIGEKAAEKQVQNGHFPHAFDLANSKIVS